jgi:hypothetical protein
MLERASACSLEFAASARRSPIGERNAVAIVGGASLGLCVACGPGSFPTPAIIQPRLQVCSLVEATDQYVTTGGTGKSVPPLRGSVREGPIPDDTWSPIASYPSPAETIATSAIPFALDVKEVMLSPTSVSPDEIHLMLVLDYFPGVFVNAHPVLHASQSADGRWGPLLDLGQPELCVPGSPNTGPLGSCRDKFTVNFERLSAAVVNGQLHVCAVGGVGQGGIWHAVRDAPNAPTELARWRRAGTGFLWENGTSGGGANKDDFVDVACAAVLNPDTQTQDLHLCAVTQDGGLWHTTLVPPAAGALGATAYGPFGDVAAVTGSSEKFARVDCVGDAGSLHLVAVTKGYRAVHTIRIPSRWRAFEDVMHSAQSLPGISWLGRISDVAVGLCHDDLKGDSSNVPQMSVVLQDRDDGHLLNTIRYAHPRTESIVAGPRSWRTVVDVDGLMGSSRWSRRAFSISPRPFLPNPFHVDALSPAMGTVGSTMLPIKVSGEGFQQLTTFDFGEGISVAQVELDPTPTGVSRAATVTIEIAAGAVPGPRLVTATQAPGLLTATLPNGFDVR